VVYERALKIAVFAKSNEIARPTVTDRSMLNENVNENIVIILVVVVVVVVVESCY